MGQDLFVIAVVVFGFGLVSGRLEGTVITPPMAYVTAGIILGSAGFGLLDLGLGQEGVRLLAEATLVIVLFSDASRIDLRVLRQRHQLPVRLLGIGLPLTASPPVAGWRSCSSPTWSSGRPCWSAPSSPPPTPPSGRWW